MDARKPDKPKIGIITDQRSLADGMIPFLQEESAFEVTDAVGGSNDEIDRLTRRAPNVVVIDQSLPDGRAFDIARSLREAHAGIHVVLLATVVSDIAVRIALDLGCDGVLSTRDPMKDLIAGLKQIAGGKQCFSKDVQRRLRFDGGQSDDSIHVESPLGKLTGRQLEILRHLACGDSVKAVARKLHLSPKSVDNHKYRIMNKIGVRDRVHLARFAIREGLIEA